jgi:diguanylate cyclase (GGDEF)-like protein/PAS domain S-box-containing protein
MYNKKKDNHIKRFLQKMKCLKNQEVIKIGIVMLLILWLLESAIHVFIFNEGSFISNLFSLDLHEIWMRLLILVIFIAFICYTGKIISKLKNAETESKEIQSELLQIFNTAADAMRIIDKEFNVIRANDTFMALTGLTKNEVIGKKCYETLSGSACHTPLCPVYQISSGKQRIEYDIEKKKKDGSSIYCILTATPFLNTSGNLIGIVEDFRDITERKKVEEELIKTRNELEIKIEEKTKSLKEANERLEIEISEGERASGQMHQLNEKLKLQLEEIEKRNQEIAFLGEMSTMLQSCLEFNETFKIISKYAEKLFPADSGAIYLYSNSRNILEEMSAWGKNIYSENVFSPHDCWALRRGQIYANKEQFTEFNCKHVIQNDSLNYLCIPLMAQGETLGLFYFQNLEEELLSSSKKMLLNTFSEHIAMALSNLRLREVLRNQAIRDPLTGLFNRRYMEETLEREISRASRQKLIVGVIMIDIDHFKLFNDTYGHKAGDIMLKEVGRFLQTNVRKEDIACRFGGEEFIVIMIGASREIIYQRAEFLRKNAKNINPEYEGSVLKNITLSIGVAIYPDHGETGESIIRAADIALYKSKHDGRDRVTIAHAEETDIFNPPE